MREHFEGIVNRGPDNRLYAQAVVQLTGPEIPDSVAYLYTWLVELHGRSGVSMSGLNPLTYSTIESWSRLKNTTPTPAEVDALIMLDGVLLMPPEVDAD